MLNFFLARREKYYQHLAKGNIARGRFSYSTNTRKLSLKTFQSEGNLTLAIFPYITNIAILLEKTLQGKRNVAYIR
jgi:hypothetical protein